MVVLAGAGEADRRVTDRVRRAFTSGAVPAEVFSDGGLTLAFAPEAGRDLHISDDIVCLLDGALYEPPEMPASGSAAARLAGAYRRRGQALLPELRGEFWTLLWDRRSGQGLVVADQIGSRGPYWAHDAGALVIAAELPELLACLSREPSPDPLALAHWLMITGPQAGTTLFAGVHAVKAGHCLRVGPGDAREERYWSPVYSEPLSAPAAEQRALLRDRLELAVRRRLDPDGRTGVLLSGGLDSSTVAALAARRSPPRAYSAVFPDHLAMDESALIERTVGRLGIASTRIVVAGGSTIGGALDYIQAWSAPPTSPNLFFWRPLLERAAADGIAVMLDGEGGDELFGFSPYLVADRLRHGRLRSALGLARRWPGEPEPPPADYVRRRLRLAGALALMPAAAHRASRRLRSIDAYAPAWLPRQLARQWLDSETSAFAWKELPGPRWWAYIVELVTRGVGPSAVYEQSRRRSSLAGVAAAHPLVDVDVIELVLRLDPELGFDPRFSRAVLRDAVAGLVPDEIRLRTSKSNFDALFHQLLAGPDLPAVRKLLDPASSELRAYVDMAALHQELLERDPRSHPEGVSGWALRVWRLATAECWLRSREGPAALEQLRGEPAPPITALRFED